VWCVVCVCVCVLGVRVVCVGVFVVCCGLLCWACCVCVMLCVVVYAVFFQGIVECVHSLPIFCFFHTFSVPSRFSSFTILPCAFHDVQCLSLHRFLGNAIFPICLARLFFVFVDFLLLLFFIQLSGLSCDIVQLSRGAQNSSNPPNANTLAHTQHT